MNKEKLIEFLQSSPIKFEKKSTNKEVKNEEIFALWINSWHKSLSSRVLRAKLSIWKVKKKRVEAIEEVKISISPECKYLKSDFIKVRLTELLQSFIRSYKKKLVFDGFKAIYCYRFNKNWRLRLSPLRNFIELLSYSRLRHGFKVLVEYNIKVVYLDKQLEIQSKLIRDRFDSGLVQIRSVFKRRLVNAFYLIHKYRFKFIGINCLAGAGLVLQILEKNNQKLLFNLLKST